MMARPRRRISTFFSETHIYPAFRLYKKDLEEVFGFFKQRCEEVDLRSGEHAYDDISHLAEWHDETLRDVRIEGKRPDVTLLISARSNKITCYYDKGKTYPLRADIEHSLMNKKRRLSLMYDGRYESLAFFVSILPPAVVAGLYVSGGSPFISTILDWWLPIYVILLPKQVLTLFRINQNRIDLSSKSEPKKSRDMLNVTVAILIGIAAIFATLYTQEIKTLINDLLIRAPDH